MPLPPTPRAPRLSRAGLIVCFYGLLAGAALLWGALRGQPNLFVHPAGPHGIVPLFSSLAIGTALGLLIVLLTRHLQERYAWARALHNEFRHLLGHLSGREIVLLAAASAIGEECFFRGALLGQLLLALPGGPPGALGAVLISSLVFGLLHIGPSRRFLPWTLSSLGIGVLLGLVYVGMGDLLGPIAIHFTVNLLNLQDITRRQLET